MAKWICALELDQDRQIIAGSEKALSNAVRRGADLQVGTAQNAVVVRFGAGLRSFI